MFEAIEQRDPAAEVRRIALAPLAAFLLELVYLTLVPLLRRVPPALFWTLTLVLLAGTIAGVAGIARFVVRRRRELAGRVLAWLIAAIAITLVCARAFLALVSPWL